MSFLLQYDLIHDEDEVVDINIRFYIKHIKISSIKINFIWDRKTKGWIINTGEEDRNPSPSAFNPRRGLRLDYLIERVKLLLNKEVYHVDFHSVGISYKGEIDELIFENKGISLYIPFSDVHKDLVIFYTLLCDIKHIKY